MTRGFYYSVVLVALLGLGLSVAIVPRDDEIAYLRFRDQHYAAALALYEKQIRNGNLSLSVVRPLSELYFKYGQIDKTIDLLEMFVERNPDFFTARKKLGFYYRFARRYGDDVRNLETLSRLKPSAALLQDLADSYYFGQDYERQLRVLADLVKNHRPDKVYYLELARLWAQKKRYRKAVSVLEQLFGADKDKPAAATVELALSLMIDAGQDQKAFNLASEYVGYYDEKNAERFAACFRLKGRETQARQLLKPFMKKKIYREQSGKIRNKENGRFYQP